MSIAIGMYLMMTTMASYAQQEFGVDAGLGGFASSAIVVGSVAGRLIIGRYLDLFGRRRTLLLSAAGFAVGALLYLVLGSFPAILAVRLVQGAIFGILNTAITTCALVLLDPARRAEGIGYFTATNSVAAAIGPFLGVQLLQLGYFAVFAVAAGLAVSSVVLAWFLYAPERTFTEAERAELRQVPRVGDLIHLPSVPVVLIAFLAGVSYSVVISFTNQFTTEIGHRGITGVIFLVIAAVALLARTFTGRLQDRIGDDVVAYPGLASLGGGLLLASTAPSTATLLVAAGLIGIGYGTMLPAVLAMAVNRSTMDRVAVITSTFALFADAGMGFGPLVLGQVATATSYATMFAVAGLIALATMGLYFLVHGRRYGRRPHTGTGETG